MSEHRIVQIWQERIGEDFSWRCCCGYVTKHARPDGPIQLGVEVARCPNDFYQTPTAVLTIPAHQHEWVTGGTVGTRCRTCSAVAPPPMPPTNVCLAAPVSTP